VADVGERSLLSSVEALLAFVFQGPPPLQSGGLATFAATDPAWPNPPDLTNLAAGVIGVSIRFLESVLYKDFTLLRAASILQAARDARDFRKPHDLS